MAGFEGVSSIDLTADAASATVGRVSVVVVSYFTGPLLLRSVGAAAADPDTAEIIVVDNGNPASLISEVRSLGRPERPLRILSGHGNIGFAAACNMGARVAAAPYVLFLNPDAVPPEGALGRLIETVDRHPGPTLVGPKIVSPEGVEQAGSRRRALTPGSALVEMSRLHRLAPRLLKDRRFNAHDEPCPGKATAVHTVSGACFFMRRADFLAMGGMDERYFLHVEDVDFCLRVRKAGGKVVFEPAVSVTHFKSSSRVSAVRVEARKARSLTTYFWSHFGDEKLSTRIYLVLVTAAVWGLFAWRAAREGVRRVRSWAGFARRSRGAGVARASRILSPRSAR